MTSDLDASAAQDAGPALLAGPTLLARPTARGGPAAPGPTAPGGVSPRRRARAALLNAGALVATTAAFAAFEAKLPRYVGD